MKEKKIKKTTISSQWSGYHCSWREEITVVALEVFNNCKPSEKELHLSWYRIHILEKTPFLPVQVKKETIYCFKLLLISKKKVFWQKVICDLICAFIIGIERKNCVFEIVRINSPSPAHRGKGRKKRVEIRRYIELTSRMFSNQWTWLKKLCAFIPIHFDNTYI